MKKCPRCEHDVKDSDKFCPHCGLDLSGRYRPIKKQSKAKSILIYALIFAFCMGLPFIFQRFTSFMIGNGPIEEGKAVQLEEVIDASPTAILGQFTSLDDFQKQFSNVGDVVGEIQDFEHHLMMNGKYPIEKDYKIVVFDNFDVKYMLDYVVNLSDSLSLKVEKHFDRIGKENDEKYIFQKTPVKSFDQLFFDADEMELVHDYTGKKEMKVMNDFHKRKNEFEEKKKTLGHYGMGEYDGRNSFVVYREDSVYYSRLTYVKNQK